MIDKDVEVVFVTSPEMAEALSGSFVRATTHLEEAMYLAEQRVGKEATVALIRGARRLIVDTRGRRQYEGPKP